MLALLTLAVALTSCGQDKATDAEKTQAIAAAKTAWQQAKANGTDFTNGPCIAEEAIDDWSVDIAHDPRQDVDNKSENQCQFYRDGKTHHFVELDPDGNVIRAK
jgi:hypothetical protein